MRASIRCPLADTEQHIQYGKSDQHSYPPRQPVTRLPLLRFSGTMANERFGEWDAEMMEAAAQYVAAGNPNMEPEYPEAWLPPAPPPRVDHPIEQAANARPPGNYNVPGILSRWFVPLLVTMRHFYSNTSFWEITSMDQDWAEWQSADITDFCNIRAVLRSLRIPIYIEAYSGSRTGVQVRSAYWLEYAAQGFPRHEVTIVVAQPYPHTPAFREQWDQYMARCFLLADTVIIEPAKRNHDGTRDYAIYTDVL
jgi:hypothetical protein